MSENTLEKKELSVSKEYFEYLKEKREIPLIDKTHQACVDVLKNFYKEVNFDKEFLLKNEETGEVLIVQIEGNKPNFLTIEAKAEADRNTDIEIAAWNNPEWLKNKADAEITRIKAQIATLEVDISNLQSEAWLDLKAKEEIANLEARKAELKVGSVKSTPAIKNIIIK